MVDLAVSVANRKGAGFGVGVMDLDTVSISSKN